MCVMLFKLLKIVFEYTYQTPSQLLKKILLKILYLKLFCYVVILESK